MAEGGAENLKGTVGRSLGGELVAAGLAKGVSGEVALVDRDVEAGLMELLFDVDGTLILKIAEDDAHPVDFAGAHAFFGDVDGSARDVGADDLADGASSIAVDALEPFLVVDGADGGADFKRVMEAGLMSVGEIGKKIGGPGAAIAVVHRQPGVDGEVARDGNGNEKAARNAVIEIGVIEDSLETVGLGALILPLKRLKRATQRRRGNNAAGMKGLRLERGLRRNVRNVCRDRRTRSRRSRGGEPGNRWLSGMRESR